MHAESPGTWVAVIGDRVENFAPQDAIAPAVEHAAGNLGIETPDTRWIGTETLAEQGSDLLAGASAVWCAPGSPYRSLTGALKGIRWARESSVPFLGTCAGFQHGVVEFARNVLGHTNAAHAEYGEQSDDAEFFIDELLCSLVGETMRVTIVEPELAELYGESTPEERYYCRFGLRPEWRQPLHEAGLRIAGVDSTDGDVRILRLADHPFFLLTLFVPQTSSSPTAPHPLVVSYVRAATASDPASREAVRR